MVPYATVKDGYDSAIIDRAQHIPPSVPRESRGCFFWASPTERSTEEETPIARAVSGSLCVCELCSPPTFVTDITFCCGFVASFINWAWP